jgi:DNA-binding transcriptional regulator YiaG
MTSRQEKSQTTEGESSVVAIKAMRAELGLSQLAFAVAIGITPTTVSRWERGKSEPELTIVQTKRLCKLVGKSLDELPDFLGQPIPSHKKNDAN